MLALGHGLKNTPRPGTTGFYLLRAKALGLSALRQMEALGIADDPAAVDMLYKSLVKEAKAPDVVAVVKGRGNVQPG